MGYQARERLGRGATGVVDLAVDDAGNLVALKHLALQGSARDMAHARRRIRREAEALARLDHPHVVRLLGIVDHDDEIVLVMPYLPGGTLADHVRTNGPLAPAQVELLADDLLDALAAAHRQGIVHRDIKPANVLFDAGGRAQLADFGMATIRDATSGLTATGAVVGTPDFMAPEQARGEPATAASDVFALGATLLYAATGQPPYGRLDPRLTLQRAARGRLAAIPADLDRGLRRRLSPLVRRDPRRRPTAAAARRGPARAEGAAPTAVLPGSLAPAGRSRRWLPAVLGVAGTLAVLLGVGAAAALRADAPTEATAREPAPTTTACAPLPYQPCGAPAAPNTDGTRCVEEHADYDGLAANGCEATPDTEDGTTFSRAVVANLVPAADVDRYPTPVDDGFQIFCNGSFAVTLTPPPTASMRVDLVVDGEIVDSAVADGAPATVRADDPSCLTSDDADVVTRVSWAGEARTAEPYQLRRAGSF